MIRILLNNQDLDLFPDEAVTLTTRTKDLFDISKIYGDFTRDFSIPASGINNTALRHFPESSIQYIPETEHDFRERQPGEIIIDGVIFRKGALQYKKTVYEYGKMAHHVMTFTSEILGLNTLFAEDTLCQLDLNQYEHVVDATNVREGMDYNGVLFNNKIIYPLISNSEPLSQTFLEGLGSHKLLPTDFRPAIQIQALLAAINVKYDISFAMDPLLNLDDLYMWMGVQPDLVQTMPWNITWPAITSGGGETTFIGGNGRHLLDENTGIMKYYSYVSYHFWEYTITPDIAQDWVLQGWWSHNLDLENDASWTAVPELMYAGTGTEIVNLALNVEGAQNYGRCWKWTLDFVNASEPQLVDICVKLDFQRQDGSNQYVYEFCSTDQLALVTSGNDFALRLPCMQIIDFLTGLMNLYLMVPVESHLQRTEFDLLAYDNYVAATPDWKITKEIDITEHTIELVPQPKAINLKYATPQAWKNKRIYHQNRGRAYGDYIESIPKGTGEAQEVTLPFENMAWIGGVAPAPQPYLVGHAFDAEVDYTAVPQPWPIVTDENPLTPIFDSAYLMIWDRSQEPVVDIDIEGFSSNVTSYKLCNSFDDAALDGGPTTNTLNFSAEQDFYRYQNRAGSYEVNWFPYMFTLLKQSARIHRYNAVIEAAKLSQISAGSLLFVHDKWFLINTMSTNALTKQSQLELVHYYRDYIPTAPVIPIEQPTPPADIWAIYDDAPTQPTNLNATDLLLGSFTLNWDASISASSTIAKYEVYRGGVLLATLLGGPPATSVGIIGMPANQDELYYVKAFDANGLESDLSDPFDFSYLVGPTISAAPTQVLTSLTTGTIEWLDAIPGGAAIDRYEFYIAVTDPFSKFRVGSQPEADPLTYTYTGLDDTFEGYQAGVRAVDVLGLTGDSPEVNVRASLGVLWNPPLVVDSFNWEEITVSWPKGIDAQGDPITHYTIFLDNVNIDTVPAGGPYTYTYTGLAEETEYELSVNAGAVSSSAGSTHLFVTTEDSAPIFNEPITISNVTQTSADISWLAGTPKASPINEYKVYQDGILVSTVPAAGPLTHSFAGLVSNFSYIITVEVIADDLQSNTSANAKIVTLEGDQAVYVGPIVFSNIQGHRMDVNWFGAFTPSSSGTEWYELQIDGELVSSWGANTSETPTYLFPSTEYSFVVVHTDNLGARVSSPPVLQSTSRQEFRLSAAPGGCGDATPTTLWWDGGDGVNDRLPQVGSTVHNLEVAGTVFNGGDSVWLAEEIFSFTSSHIEITIGSDGVVTDRTYCFPLNPPTGLNATLIDYTTFTLNWIAPASGPAPTGYALFRNGVRLISSNVWETSRNIIRELFDETSVWAVRATDASGESYNSVQIGVTTLGLSPVGIAETPFDTSAGACAAAPSPTLNLYATDSSLPRIGPPQALDQLWTAPGGPNGGVQYNGDWSFYYDENLTKVYSISNIGRIDDTVITCP